MFSVFSNKETWIFVVIHLLCATFLNFLNFISIFIASQILLLRYSLIIKYHHTFPCYVALSLHIILCYLSEISWMFFNPSPEEGSIWAKILDSKIEDSNGLSSSSIDPGPDKCFDVLFSTHIYIFKILSSSAKSNHYNKSDSCMVTMNIYQKFIEKSTYSSQSSISGSCC